MTALQVLQIFSIDKTTSFSFCFLDDFSVGSDSISESSSDSKRAFSSFLIQSNRIFFILANILFYFI